MKAVAPGVVQLKSSPVSSNVYVLGRTLVDAGTRRGGPAIARQIRGRGLERLVLTHAHPPPQGGAAGICRELGLELCCGRGDVEIAESGETASAQPAHWFNPLQQRLFAGPGHPVARALREGDEVDGFEVLEVPGHSPGHVALWREADRVLILGDVLNNQNVWTGRPGLREPPALFTPDPARNRESARRLAALRPALTLFGHGPALRDPDALEDFVARLDDPAPA
jgi:glyoxylase-like metal-dependent hydrolase (beta-lactamase superfamily II)